MSGSRIAVVIAFVVVLALPFLVGRAGGARGDAEFEDVPPERTLIVVSPHVEQIRWEFERAFSRWHRERYGEPVAIDWRTPGGTSEIIDLLRASYEAAIRDGRITPEGECPAGTMGMDVFFGGGSYDHGRVKSGVTVTLRGGEAGGGERRVTVPMSVAAGFSRERMTGWFGDNLIGVQNLSDPDQYWIGTALSSFGIVYNRDEFAGLGLSEPDSFGDLTHPGLIGRVALADPRMSGSVTTTYDSILNVEGWDAGWRMLREMSANARYFASSSTKPPLDVSMGDAAAGVAIDFYGRGQAQAILAPDESPASARVGYVDPKGATYVDADPVSILRGGPHPELARRFVEFCLSDLAQSLWQFEAGGDDARPDGLGPLRYELRRMPVRRDFYMFHVEHFIDRIDPFEIAAQVESRGWRSGIAPMMAAFGIETADELRKAWRSLLSARANPAFPPETLADMERAFYAMPEHEMPDGSRLLFSEANYGAIRADWRDASRFARAKIAYQEFFRGRYREVVRLARTGGAG